MAKIKKILFPTDFSKYSDDALQYAISIASAFKAKLYILHVIEGARQEDYFLVLTLTSEEIEEKLMEEAKKNLEKLVSKNLSQKIEFETSIKSGTPFVEIIRAAKQEDIDLIVMSSHGRSGISEILIGSVTERVLRAGVVPILTVRAPKATEKT